MAIRFNHTSSDIALYDTNVWVHGIAAAEGYPTCADLVDATYHENQSVYIPAYVFQEVVDTFGSGRVQGQDDYATAFAKAVYSLKNIEFPSRETIAEMDVLEERDRHYNTSIRKYSGCEAKDAPVLAAAIALADARTHVTIYTNDESFAKSVLPGDVAVTFEAVDVD